MKDAYRYVIHAYEDARQKRPMKHEHWRPPFSPTARRRSDEPNCSPESSPMGGSTSTSSTEERKCRWQPRRSIRKNGSTSTISSPSTRMTQGTGFGLYLANHVEGEFSSKP